MVHWHGNYKNIYSRIKRFFTITHRANKILVIFSSFCIGRKFCVNTYWHRVGKDIQQLPKSDKGIRDLKACLDYSYHHARSCEFEFLLSCTNSLAISTVILKSQYNILNVFLEGCLIFLCSMSFVTKFKI